MKDSSTRSIKDRKLDLPAARADTGWTRSAVLGFEDPKANFDDSPRIPSGPSRSFYSLPKGETLKQMREDARDLTRLGARDDSEPPARTEK